MRAFVQTYLEQSVIPLYDVATPTNVTRTPKLIPGLFPGLCAVVLGFAPCFERFLFTVAISARAKNPKQYNGLSG
ncbi:hypothetical protein ABIE89_006492 [Bradyrhizobium niftali]